MTDLVFSAFSAELEKQARLGALLRTGGSKLLELARQRASRTGAGAALGAAGGGALGGVGGAVKGYREAEESGQSGLAGALGGFGSGAMRGAALGGGAGALGGAAGLGRGAAAAVQQAAKGRGVAASGARAVESVGRLGQRQIHALTGAVPGGAARGTPEYMKAMRDMGFTGGRSGALERVQGARKALTSAKASGNAGAVEKATKELSRFKDQYRTAREAEQKGLTSVPGFVKSLGSKEGLKDVWRLGIKPQWQQQGALGKALVGLPVATALPELATSAEEDPEGRTRGARFGQALGSGLGYATTPFIPMAGSEIMGRAGGALGKGIGSLISGGAKKKPPPMQELGNNPSAPGVEESGTSQAVPREYTNAALGRPPEGLML